jgi:hypothetical protein
VPAIGYAFNDEAQWSRTAMKLTSRFAIALLTFTIVAALSWSAHLGRKVWSPRVFAWRNFFKPQPIIEEQPDCPVRLVHPRFYSFMSIGSSVGSVLKIDVKNVSSKPIHSFTISYRSSEPSDMGSGGWHPEKLLQPGQYETIGSTSNSNESVAFAVDFVQFADGDVWYADPPRATVKPMGVRMGARAAHEYLLKTLEADGAAAVIAALPGIRIHIEPPGFQRDEAYGYFGFYCGVTKTAVQVEHAYREGGLSSVEKFLFLRKH